MPKIRKMDQKLLDKYNVAVPRYTSYPTVPLWDTSKTNVSDWMDHVRMSFNESNEISLYIHLPYCESLCTYCGCNKHITKNHLVEEPYINAVLKEWGMYLKDWDRKPVIRELHLGGGTPSFFSPANLGRLIEGLLADAEVPEDSEFSFEAHPFSTNFEHLRVLYNLGFRRLSLGVQDFDEGVLQIINREQTIEQVVTVTQQARMIGYTSINYDLIYGLPGQKPSHIKRNLMLLSHLRPDRIAFYSYAHIPDVKKSQRAYSERDLPSASEKMALYLKGKEGLEEMGYAEIGMDHFALPSDSLYKALHAKRLHRNFMGYTPHRTNLSIGLGVSAISDSWTAYSQNEKTVKEYLMRVRNETSPPVIKNHFLTEEDMDVRRRLLNLICNFELEGFPVDSDALINSGLRDFEEDGLIKLMPNGLKVTATGKSFIRNICTILDRRMPMARGEKPTFSKAV